MRNAIAAVWFRRLVLLSTLLAFCVVGLGAYVRLSDAGLGCPDWPGCYGYMSVPESEAAIAQAQVAYPDSPVETHKAWKEMVHRYLAGILGLFMFNGVFCNMIACIIAYLSATGRGLDFSPFRRPCPLVGQQVD